MVPSGVTATFDREQLENRVNLSIYTNSNLWDRLIDINSSGPQAWA